jgi:hypothetical protein
MWIKYEILDYDSTLTISTAPAMLNFEVQGLSKAVFTRGTMQTI